MSRPSGIKLSSVIELLRQQGLFVSGHHLPSDSDFLISYPVTDTRDVLNKSAQAKQITATKVLTAFICITGYTTDGHIYAAEAVSQGAGVLIAEKMLPDVEVPYIIVSDSRRTLALLAKLFYDDPSSKFFLIGVTGTNGKTSTVKIIEHILTSLEDSRSDHQREGKSGVATIGTLGYTIRGKEYPLARTTPDITELNDLFDLFVKEKIKYVVMEVSSHALKLDRVYGLNFDVALFTNLSREHLDFHSDMDDYFRSKALLFDYLAENKGTAIINISDEKGNELYQNYRCKKVSLANKSASADVTFSILSGSSEGTLIKLECTEEVTLEYGLPESISFPSQLIGEHNAFNVTLALMAAIISYRKNQDVLDKSLTSRVVKLLPAHIKGRLQRCSASKDVSCFIDYAHTPDALQFTCKTLKQLIDSNIHSINSIPPELPIERGGTSSRPSSPRLICVFGAGGNRDRGKRSEMMDVVMKYADLTIITSDNPRDENPIDIIFDIIENYHPLSPYWVVTDRREAIKTAIAAASSGDIVLIAGKGHEDYQIIGKNKLHFDDFQEAETALRAKAAYYNDDKPEYTNRNEGTPMTTRLSIPLDPVQVLLLLLYCTSQDLSFDTKAYIQENVLSVKQEQSQESSAHYTKMKEVRNQIKDFSGSYHTMIRYVSTDTRTIKQNSLYLALKGEHFDGHNYVDQALEQEATFAVVNRNSSIKQNTKTIAVADTYTALALIAKKYKSLFNAARIAITGSTGKTTTREIVYNVLSQDAPALSNTANENNLIGVSRTILNLSSRYSYLVMEAGTNQCGEMQVLADICEPHIAVITNIGPCHLEAFKTLQGVYDEKSRLLSYQHTLGIIDTETQKYAKQNPIDRCNAKTEPCPANNVVISTPATGMFVLTNQSGIEHRFSIHPTLSTNQPSDFESHNPGDTHSTFEVPSDIPFVATNASYAVTIAYLSGISSELIHKGLLQELSLKNRMQLVTTPELEILLDCYNANPVSMKAAIDYWAENNTHKQHIAILGDMLELGEQADKYHQEIGDHLKTKLATRQYRIMTISVGKKALLYGAEHHFKSTDELLASELLDCISKSYGSYILLKGSRGIRLEKLTNYLIPNPETCLGNESGNSINPLNQ